MPFPRICKKCNRRFQPEGKNNRCCKNCLKDIKNVNFIKLICNRRGLDLDKLKKIW